MRNKAYTVERDGRWSDTDPANVMYFANYPMFFDEGIVEAVRKAGITWDDREKIGFYMPVVDQQVSYKNPVTAGIMVKIYTVIDMLRDRVFRSRHVMTKMHGHSLLTDIYGDKDRETYGGIF